jgi:ribosome-associated protein
MLPPETLAPMRIAAEAAAGKKAFQMVGLEVTELTSYTDSFLLCSAASDRQVAAVVDGVVRQLKNEGRKPIHVEGEGRAGWVLIDYGDFIVHVFTEEKRGYYALDNLWGDAPRVEPEELGLTNGGASDSS